MKENCWRLMLCMIFLAGMSGMSGCQNHKTEIVLDDQEVTAEPEKMSDDMQKQTDATESPTETNASVETNGTEAREETESSEIFVDVCGAVVSPGVYEMSADSRIFQAIEAAGGLLPEAASSAVNQAQPVSDGQQIYVPTQEEVEEGALPAAIQSSGSTGGAEASADGIVNINTADASALKSLTGIGDAKAQAILSYREEHGSFSSIEEIMQVPGIKESTFSAIKDKIAVK